MNKTIAILTGGLLAVMLLITQPVFSEEGRTSVSETFGDWTVVCRQPVQAGKEKARGSCQMSQELRQQKAGQRVLTLAIPAATADSGAKAVLVTPFGLKLSQGVVITIDGKRAIKAPFQTCLPLGCVVQLFLNKDTLRALRNGKKATVMMAPLKGEKPLRIAISLSGFTAAWSRLHALAPEFG